MYQVRIIGQKEFEACREPWNRLVLSMRIPSIFCTWEWILTWQEHYGAAYAPLFLSVYEGQALKGILPLARHATADSTPSAWKRRTLSYCGSMELYPDYVDLICSEEDSEGCIEAVVEFLTTQFTAWDLLHIALLSEGSRLVTGAGERPASLTPVITPGSVSPYIAFTSHLEDVAKAFGSTLKNNLKRRQRQLFEQQGVQYVSCPPSQEADGLRTLFDLHQRRAARKQISSTFKGDRLLAFHSALVRRMEKNGWVWLRFLKKEDELIAAFYGFSIGKRVFYYQMGFDPEWERHSPGMVLLYEVIKEAFVTQHKEFDFLRGGETYKSLWTQNQRPLVGVTLYNTTLRGRVAKAVSSSRDAMRRYVRRLTG